MGLFRCIKGSEGGKKACDPVKVGFSRSKERKELYEEQKRSEKVMAAGKEGDSVPLMYNWR